MTKHDNIYDKIKEINEWQELTETTVLKNKTKTSPINLKNK